MIHIKKNTPPKKFQEFKQQNPHAHFDDMTTDVKAILRRTLLEEQGYLCAYCMSKIHDDPRKTKIEHYEPRNAQNELKYSNLLVVCTGNSSGTSFERQHCDTKKGNQHLHIDPQNIDHIRCISYLSDGTIYAKDNPDFDEDLNSTLNLNDEYGYLKSARKRALDELKKTLQKKLGTKTAGRTFLEKLLRFYQSKDQNDNRQPYCGILIDYLLKRLKKAV